MKRVKDAIEMLKELGEDKPVIITEYDSPRGKWNLHTVEIQYMTEGIDKDE